MKHVRLATSLFVIMFMILLFVGGQNNVPAAQAATSISLNIADFEGGVDSRAALNRPSGLTTGGPYYAWNTIPSISIDDINYWDVYSDSDAQDEYVDYVLSLGMQENWQNFTSLQIKYSLGCSYCPAGNNMGIRVYIHDADGTGNSDGNGYQNLGTYINNSASIQTLLLPLSGATNRNQIDHLLIRVYESFFGAVQHSGWIERVHLYSITALGSTNIPSVSILSIIAGRVNAGDDHIQ